MSRAAPMLRERGIAARNARRSGIASGRPRRQPGNRSDGLGLGLMGIRDKIRFAWNNGLRFTAVRILARLIYPELRLRYNSQDWLNDRAFNEYLELFAETRGINSGRRWMVYQLLRATQEVPGDTAECGVFQGATSYIICAFAEAAR